MQQQNLKNADYALDGSGASFATSWIAGKAVAQETAAAAAKRTAGALAAAEFAEGTAGLYGAIELLTGWGGVILFGGYLYYKYTKDDPPDSHFRSVATPHVRGAALDVRGMTGAEATAVRALAANTQHLLAVARVLATTQNRATGARAAGQADWVQRQTDAAKQYAKQIAGLLDAQPAQRAALRQALAADPRFPTSIQLGSNEVRDFQSDMAAHGVPIMSAQVAQQLGFTASDLAELRSSIMSADAAAVAGISYPGVLTDPRVTAFDRRGAASWRRFSAGVCTLQPMRPLVTPTTPPSSSAGDLQQDGKITVGPVGSCTGCTWTTAGAGSLSGTVTADLPSGHATYTWSVPSVIPRSGADGTLKLTVDEGRAGTFSNLEAELWVAGEVDTTCTAVDGSCAHIQAYSKGGNLASAASTFTLKARGYSAGRKDPVIVTIGCAWGGPRITIPYRIIQ